MSETRLVSKAGLNCNSSTFWQFWH